MVATVMNRIGLRRLLALGLPLWAVAAACNLPAQDVPAKTPTLSARDAAIVEQHGIRCGLGPAFHRGRRDELLRQLADGSVFVLRGMPATRDYMRFHQDKTFWYLTGVSSPNAALILDKASGRQILLLPENNLIHMQMEAWDGEVWDTGDRWVGPISGFTEVRGENELRKILTELKKDGTRVCTCLHPMAGLAGGYDRARPAEDRARRDEWYGQRGRRSTFRRKLEEILETKVEAVDRILFSMRRIKTRQEIEVMRQAARIGALGMCEAMRSTRAGVFEREIEAVIDLVTRRAGAQGPAYQAIVGSGPNALVLHYNGNARRMQHGDMVLCDYGPQLEHYTTDITRSWPVTGKFGKRAAELYDAVLAAQKAGIAVAKPGSTIYAVEMACRRSLTRAGLEDLIRHGACHLIGLEVHDPTIGPRYLRQPLEPGVTFTIEPGVYDPEHKIGIRIEDTILITNDGCEVLSAAVPKERAEIEAMVAEKGVLDWLDAQRENAR